MVGKVDTANLHFFRFWVISLFFIESYPLSFIASFGVYCEKSYASSVRARLIIWNKKAENIIFMLRKVDNEHKTFDLQWLDAYDKCGKIMQYAI